MASNGCRSQYFAIVLYDEDKNHKRVLEYLASCPLWLDYYILICHDKDIVEPIRYTESEQNPDAKLPRYNLVKKRHYHVLLRLKCRTHLKPFLNLFRIRGDELVVNYALVVVNPFAYVTYMLHQDFESLNDDTKHKYKIEDLRFSPGAEKLLDRQNGNFVQYFQDIMDRLSDGEDLFTIIKSALNVLPPRDAEEYLKIVRGFQYLFVQRGSSVSYN